MAVSFWFVFTSSCTFDYVFPACDDSLMIVTIFLLLFGKIVQDAIMVMVMDDESFSVCVRVQMGWILVVCRLVHTYSSVEIDFDFELKLHFGQSGWLVSC